MLSSAPDISGHAEGHLALFIPSFAPFAIFARVRSSVCFVASLRRRENFLWARERQHLSLQGEVASVRGG